MPIRPFLNGEQFDQETVRILGVAFEQVCIALRIGACDDDVKQAIANKIIALAKTGERNPDLLCECALEDIRQPQAYLARRVTLLGRILITAQIAAPPVDGGRNA